MRSSHQPVAAHRRRPTSFDVFQSSWTSWSSKIIAAGHGREQPADVRLRPRLAVQPRVLLEVRDRLAGRHLGIAARADVLAHPRRHLVGVDLVAEQHERVRPARRVRQRHMWSASTRSASTSRPSGCSSLRSECGGSCGAQTRQEPQAIRNGALAPVRADRRSADTACRARATRARRPAAPRRGSSTPARAPCSARARSGGRRRANVRLAAAEHLDLAGGVGLDPDRRLVLPRVAEERPEGQTRHQPASARSARTASISAGRSPVPSTVSEAVTEASRRHSGARASR